MVSSSSASNVTALSTHPSTNAAIAIYHYYALLAAQWLAPYWDTSGHIAELASAPTAKRFWFLLTSLRVVLDRQHDHLDTTSRAAIKGALDAAADQAP